MVTKGVLAWKVDMRVRVMGQGSAPSADSRSLLPAPDYFAYLNQFKQHFKYLKVFVWNNTHVKRGYPILTGMW